jgi:hypothetical protein
MSEVANIRANNESQLLQIIENTLFLAMHLKPVKWGDKNDGLRLLEEIIVKSYCTLYFSHLEKNDFNEIVENTMGYFNKGLCDCNKILLGDWGICYPVSGWVYTPDAHNDAGEWYQIFVFIKSEDAGNCVIMLRAISNELEKLHYN